MTGFTVLGARVVVVPLEKTVETPGGIILPDNFIPEPEVCGTVVGIGKLEHASCDVGDKVFFSPHAGFECNVGGKRMLVIPESQILAVLDKE